MERRPIVFPADAQAHDNIIEWWYWNGHCTAKDGRKFSLMTCLFRADTKKVNLAFLRRFPLPTIYFSHEQLTEFSADRTRVEINPVSLVSRDSFSRPLLFVNYTHPSLRGYTNCAIEQLDEKRYRLKSQYADLTLVARKPPLLVGGDGFVTLRERSTFYYSLPRLEADGWLILDGAPVPVTGQFWMDHQWADQPYAEDTWVWFSVQLDNGLDFVCFRYDDGQEQTLLASLSPRRGKPIHSRAVILKAGDWVWQSPATGATYPVSWTIEIPDQKISLTCQPMRPDQEMIFGYINYWEGPMRVRGTVDGKPVSGNAFMELVGYPMAKGKFRVLEREIRTKVNSSFRALRQLLFNKS